MCFLLVTAMLWVAYLHFQRLARQMVSASANQELQDNLSHMHKLIISTTILVAILAPALGGLCLINITSDDPYPMETDKRNVVSHSFFNEIQLIFVGLYMGTLLVRSTYITVGNIKKQQSLSAGNPAEIMSARYRSGAPRGGPNSAHRTPRVRLPRVTRSVYEGTGEESTGAREGGGGNYTERSRGGGGGGGREVTSNENITYANERSIVSNATERPTLTAAETQTPRNILGEKRRGGEEEREREKNSRGGGEREHVNALNLYESRSKSESNEMRDRDPAHGQTSVMSGDSLMTDRQQHVPNNTEATGISDYGSRSSRSRSPRSIAYKDEALPLSHSDASKAFAPLPLSLRETAENEANREAQQQERQKEEMERQKESDLQTRIRPISLPSSESKEGVK